MTSAGRVWPSAMTSNQSCAQLKWPSSSGNEKVSTALSWSSRSANRRSRAARYLSVDDLTRSSPITSSPSPGVYSGLPAAEAQPRQRHTLASLPLGTGSRRAPAGESCDVQGAGPRCRGSALDLVPCRPQAEGRAGHIVKGIAGPILPHTVGGVGVDAKRVERGSQRPPGVADTLDLGADSDPASGSVQ